MVICISFSVVLRDGNIKFLWQILINIFYILSQPQNIPSQILLCKIKLYFAMKVTNDVKFVEKLSLEKPVKSIDIKHLQPKNNIGPLDEEDISWNNLMD
jgi:hypothetical protein